VRYCLHEDVRLDAMRPLAVSNDQVARFNGAIEDYNARCGRFRYWNEDKAAVERELLGMRSKLQRDGAARIPAATSSRQVASQALAQSRSDLQEKPSTAPGRPLRLEELRYCRYEEARLDGARSALGEGGPVAVFNLAVRDYNLRCVEVEYWPEDHERVTAELNLLRLGLEREGISRYARHE